MLTLVGALFALFLVLQFGSTLYQQLYVLAVVLILWCFERIAHALRLIVQVLHGAKLVRCIHIQL